MRIIALKWYLRGIANAEPHIAIARGASGMVSAWRPMGGLRTWRGEYLQLGRPAASHSLKRFTMHSISNGRHQLLPPSFPSPTGRAVGRIQFRR